jgi:hypothetical protein
MLRQKHRCRKTHEPAAGEQNGHVAAGVSCHAVIVRIDLPAARFWAKMSAPSTAERMHMIRHQVFAAIVLVSAAGTAMAQAPAPAPLQTPNPSYASIEMTIDVNRPAAEVWKRVGKYCDIGEWFQMPAPCTITSGKDGEFGAVRSVANEILVAKTELSYTYTQPVREGVRYNMYHGTLEARPVTATTSKIVYTLFFDNSNLADDAAKQADKDRRRTQFMRGMQNMKTLAEGGTLPPPPARGGR